MGEYVGTNAGYHSIWEEGKSGGSGAGIKTFGILFENNFAYLTAGVDSDVKITAEDIPNEPFIIFLRKLSYTYFAFPEHVRIQDGECDIGVSFKLFPTGDLEFEFYVDESGHISYPLGPE